jgi:pimeloyl-ACP methyl ester carboxylesterase
MRTIAAGLLNVAYRDLGPEDGRPVVLLHGFPYDAHAYDAVADHLAGQGLRVVVPFLRGFGATRFLAADTPRSGEQAALGFDLLALMDALSLRDAVLAGYDWGGRAACIVAALWPERVRGLVSCGLGYNIQDIAAAGEPEAPEVEARFWYQYYFHSARGRAALERDRRGVCRFLWQTWSPSWRFDDATFERSAAAFDNPDFVAVVIHSYRHRYGGLAGDPALAGIEARLAAQPDIAVPTVVLQGGDDGVDPPAPIHGAAHFKGGVRRAVVPGVGHNVPQEAPDVFAAAVLEVMGG